MLLLLFISPLSLAECNNKSETCIDINKWHFSIAIGAGTLTNPLYGGKNIPLVVIPYIHYYDDNFFIENNVIGYSFYQSEQLVVSAVSQLNKENAYFSNWQASHLLLPNFSESIASDFGQNNTVDKRDISKRKWALDAGIQINWFISDSLELKAQLLHDINKAYQGFNANIALTNGLTFASHPNTNINITGGINWLSEALANYYYGLDDSDNVELHNLYQAKSGIQPFISLNITHKLSDNWQLSLSVKNEYLDDNLTNSPLIEESHITSVFIGVVYEF